MERMAVDGMRYVDPPDIPAGMTIDEFRRSRRCAAPPPTEQVRRLKIRALLPTIRGDGFRRPEEAR